MAYSRGPPAPITPFVANHHYSSLQQERSYLLSALATEESRAEHMNRTLGTIRAKLEMAGAHEDSTEMAGNLTKAAAAITRKLKKCYKSERAMANNLAAVTTRMQMLEQHQWRKAQFEYSQRVQQTPIYGMALGLLGMTLESPISPAYGYPCMPYPPTSYTLSPLSGTIPSVPTTPFLQPQQMMSIEGAWNAALPTPYYEQFQMPFGISTPFNTPQPSMPATWQNMDIQYSPYAYAKSNEPMKRSRRMSLPDPPRMSSWHTEGLLGGIEEEPPAREHIEPGRRLSMISCTGASLRM